MSIWKNLRDRLLEALRSLLEGRAPSAPEGDCYGVGWEIPAAAAPAEPSAAPESVAGAVPSAPSSAPISWRYGAFDGSRAAEDPRCRLSALRIGSTTLSLHWDTAIPSDWSRSRTDKGALVVVAAFYLDASGVWIGGKFDWIDEARSTRSLENIAAGYGGWNAAAFFAAAHRAICVVSADGKWRSNLLEEAK